MNNLEETPNWTSNLGIRPPYCMWCGAIIDDVEGCYCAMAKMARELDRLTIKLKSLEDCIKNLEKCRSKG